MLTASAAFVLHTIDYTDNSHYTFQQKEKKLGEK